MRGIIATAFVQAEKETVAATIEQMFPYLGAMTEIELQPIVDGLRGAHLTKKCPYTDREFKDPHFAYVMHDGDGKFAVGCEDYMKLRSLRDGSPYIDLSDIEKAVFAVYQPLREAREKHEAEEAKRLQRRQEQYDQVFKVAMMLQRLNEIDGLDMLPSNFEATLVKVATASGISEEAILVYWDVTKKPQEAETVAA